MNCSDLDVLHVTPYREGPFKLRSLMSTTVVGESINIMKTTFDLNFDFIKLLNSMDTQKNENKENLSIKKASINYL